jgi:hypothetical protein
MATNIIGHRPTGSNAKAEAAPLKKASRNSIALLIASPCTE